MGHAISDARARDAVNRLRNRGINDGEVHALMMYVAERLPLETKPARTVMWRFDGDGLGSIDHVFEHELPDFVRSLLARGDLQEINIRGQVQKPVR